jgi:hypothetical protein
MTGNDLGLDDLVTGTDEAVPCLLVVDTKLCKHSRRLMEEVRIATTLTPSKVSCPATINVLDLKDREADLLPRLSWVPGVPCLLLSSTAHLGVDAFAKCRELCRSMQGVKLQYVKQ